MRGFLACLALSLGFAALVMGGLQLSQPLLGIAATGDIMLGRDVAQAHREGGWDQVLAAFESLTADADLRFANLESPLTAAPLIKPSYDLRAPADALQALQIAGFDILALANNHALDAGVQGMLDTRFALLSAGIHPLDTDTSPYEMQHQGIPLHWFAFDDSSHALDPNQLHLALQSATDHDVVTLVSIHWGDEYQAFPNERQRLLAQALADAGADIILGHHPHVLQPIEWVWGQGRGRPTLVAYSLGNALFDQFSPPGTRYGAILVLELGPRGVRRACAVPVQLDPQTMRMIPAGRRASDAVARHVQVACLQDEKE